MGILALNIVVFALGALYSYKRTSAENLDISIRIVFISLLVLAGFTMYSYENTDWFWFRIGWTISMWLWGYVAGMGFWEYVKSKEPKEEPEPEPKPVDGDSLQERIQKLKEKNKQ